MNQFVAVAVVISLPFSFPSTFTSPFLVKVEETKTRTESNQTTKTANTTKKNGYTNRGQFHTLWLSCHDPTCLFTSYEHQSLLLG